MRVEAVVLVTHIRNRDAPCALACAVTAAVPREGIQSDAEEPVHATPRKRVFPPPRTHPGYSSTAPRPDRRVPGRFRGGGARASSEDPEKKRDEGARRRRRRCTSHVLLGPSRIDRPEVCSSPTLVICVLFAVCRFSRERSSRTSDRRRRGIRANRLCSREPIPAFYPRVHAISLLFVRSAGDESEFIVYIIDVRGIIYEDELIIIELVNKCSTMFEGIGHWCVVEKRSI